MVQLHHMQRQEAAERRQLALIRELLLDLGQSCPKPAQAFLTPLSRALATVGSDDILKNSHSR